MRKISVIGGVGAGKTTLALQLGRLLDVEVIHLDHLFHGVGAGKGLRARCQSRLDSALLGPRYLIEGVYPWTYPQRIAECDALIWLDIAPRVRFWGILRRGVSRLWARCTMKRQIGPPPIIFPPLRFWWGFLLDCHENHAGRAVAAADRSPGPLLIRLRSRDEVSAFLDSLRK